MEEIPNMDPEYLENETIPKPSFTYFEDGKIEKERIVIDRESFIKEVVYDREGRIVRIVNYRKDEDEFMVHDLTNEVMRSGLAFTYYRNGTVQSLRYYVDGAVHWVEKIFAPSGRLVESISYQKGKKNGPHATYSKKNKKLSEINYHSNIPHGKASYFYSNGEKKADIFFDEGKKTGESKIYFENGVLRIKENLVDDVRTGMTETYYESGGIKEKWNFKDGLPNDECLFFYNDGSLYASRNFNEGKENGISKYYYKGTNQVKEEISFKSGRKEGVLRQYDENGNVTKEIHYKKDKVINEDLLDNKTTVNDQSHIMTTGQKIRLAVNYIIMFIVTILIIYAIYFYLII